MYHLSQHRYWVILALCVLVIECTGPLSIEGQSLQTTAIGGRLAVPFIHQYSDQYINPFYTQNCGPASVAMIIEAYGKRPVTFTDDAKFIKDIRDKTTVPGNENTGFKDLIQVLSHEMYQLPTTIISGPAPLQQIKDSLAQRKPVIALVNSNHEIMSRAYGGHWLVVTGFSLDGNYVFINDPDLRRDSMPKWNKATPSGQVRWLTKDFEQALDTTGRIAISVGDGLPESAVLPPEVGAFGGFVKDTNGQPVANATVIIVADRVINVVTKTDTTGRFRFSNIPSGDVIVAAIRGSSGGTVNIQIESLLSMEIDPIIIRPSTNNQIILPESAKVTAKFISTGSPNDQTMCTGNFSQYLSGKNYIFSDYLQFAGLPVSLNIAPAQTEFVFSLTPQSFCSGATYLSTDTRRAVVLHPKPLTWIIAWEDYTDVDFNDLVVRLEGQAQPIPFLDVPFATKSTDTTAASIVSHVSYFFDHEYPTASLEPNLHTQYYVTYDGNDSQIDGSIAPITASYDGNNGTDFDLTPNTPLWAAAPGTIIFAGQENHLCPGREQATPHKVVKVRHENGYTTEYWGLKDIASSMVEGAPVLANESSVLGHSGTRPCTAHGRVTNGLHFVVRNPRGLAVDPFGWNPLPTSQWYGLNDSWQQYNAPLDTNAISYRLWVSDQDIFQLYTPSQPMTLMASDHQISVHIPSGAFNSPLRIELKETGSLAMTPFLQPLRGLHVFGFGVNDAIITQSQKPIQIEVALAESSSPSIAAGLMQADSSTPYVYAITQTAQGMQWQRLETTWDSTTQTARAMVSQLGTYIVAIERKAIFLPSITQ